jgi:hypothetical protein
VHEAAFVRLSRFRTTRPAFDAVLRGSVLPDIRARPGVLAVFAGRQGPDEIGARVLAVVASRETISDSSSDPAAPAGSEGDPFAETLDRSQEILPALIVRLADQPLSTGILRFAQGRLGDTSLSSYANLVTTESRRIQADGGGPRDLVMAAAGEDAFVMLSTWPDWSAIEAATGASISEPLRTKRLGALSSFEVAHFELLTDRASETD